MKPKKTFSSYLATFSAIGGLLALYGWMQADDNAHKLTEPNRKAEAIKSTKTEYQRRKKWADLESESVRLTFPIEAYENLSQK